MLSIAVEEDELSWDLHLPTLLLAYWTSIHETTGATPFELMFGREPRVPEDVMFPIPDSSLTSSNHGPKKYAETLRSHLAKAYERVQLYSKRKQQHQKLFYVRGFPYQMGDLVLLHDPVVKRGCSRKFHRPWKGPFKVVKILSPTVYHVQDCKHSRKRKVVHFNRLKPAHYDNIPAPTLPSTSTDSSDVTQSASESSDDLGDDSDYIVYFPIQEEPFPQQHWAKSINFHNYT